MMDQVLRARNLVADALKCSVDIITDDAGVESTPLWDSLGHMSIILAVEQALGRALMAEEIASIGSVGDIAKVMGRSHK